MEKDKIAVGEYIRTKKKGIFKVLSIRKTPYGYYCGTVDNDKIKTFTIGKGGSAEIKNDIVKHSKNILDLIEVGDIAIVKNGLGEEELIFIDNEDKKRIVRTHKIKSVVTKEQFKEMEYRV